MSTCPFSSPSRFWHAFAEMRETPGLTWDEAHGCWIVSRYDDIVAALHDPAIFSSRPVVPPLPPEYHALLQGKVPDRGTLIGHDNPTHDRLRKAVNTFFMPRRIARYQSWIEAQAHALIDEFYEEGEVDFLARFSSPLPLKAISHIIGLDTTRSEDYREALQFFPNPSMEGAQRLLAFHALLEETMEERRIDRRDDLISHVWNMRDAGEAVLTDFEMLSLFPGLMLAGHETSSNLIVMALAHMLARPGVYERAQENDVTRAQALEEAFRFEGPITGMPREVTRPVMLSGTQLEPGDRIFLAYASGNRDPRHFADGDSFHVARGTSTQHIGFGQGIHACLGAPLARLLLKVELRVIAERLPGLRLAQPYEAREYHPLREVRAMVETSFAWDVLDTHRAKRSSHARPEETAADDGWINAHVVAKRPIAAEVAEVRIAAEGGTLPEWAPGAHAEIELPNGVIRQYSLCGIADPAGEWTIGVLREEEGRGGSRYIHEVLEPGDRLRVRPPRNHFPILPTEGLKLLVAGGIGITPLLPMAEHLSSVGADWRLVYLGRSLDRMAYRDRLAQLDPARILIWPSNDHGRFDLAASLAGLPRDATVYCCGPEPLVAAVEGLCDSNDLSFRVERFSPGAIDTSDDRPFQVVLQSSGRAIAVGATESLLQALAREGVPLLSTCQQGTCGSCEVGVVEGNVLHRDSVLTREERAASDTMMACVSRCSGDRLVLRL